MADTTTTTSFSNPTQIEIKHKTTDGKIINIHPLTDASIVQTTNNTTVQEELDNAIPLVAGDHISILPSSDGLAISFTGSLAPNVTVTGTDPIVVSETKSETSATYAISHKASGVTAGTYGATANVSTSTGNTTSIKVPSITVDSAGHVTGAVDRTLSIAIPSTSNNVTATGIFNTGEIIIGSGNNNKTVKSSNVTITTNTPTSSSTDSTIPTSKAVNAAIDAKITANAQYLGTFGTLADLTASGTIGSKAKVIGSWARAALSNGEFEMWDVSTGAKTTVHNGDIVILTSTTVTATTTGSSWDVIHTEIDNNTWRTIQIKGTSIGNNTFNLAEGTNVQLVTSTANNITTATINATDTKYTLGHDQDRNKNDLLNTVKITPNSTASAQVITINDVAHATKADNATSATTATTADKVAYSLTFKNAAGTATKTYNGSADVSITAADVGASSTTHTHELSLMGDVSGTTTDLTKGITTTIADGKVTTSKIKDANVTTTKIASGAVTDDKLSTTGVTAGTYSAVTVNTKGRVTAGAQLIQMYAKNTADATIIADGSLVGGGFAFVALN